MSEPWTLPGYDVEVLIGFGATGEVWRARELATGDTVALKRLREVADPVALASLRREAALLRTLDSPYVIRLRAVVEDVLVLDHAPGGSLAALLSRRGRLDPGEVVTIAAPLASGLAAAHALGLVHGDVSPANVLLTSQGMPLLADLGVARITGQRLATVDGTAEYVDPAVAAGGDPDAAADVWALAALCHHLLAGTPPHDGTSAAEVLDNAVAGARAPLGLLAPEAPRALVEVVEAGLRSDPRSRPDAAAFSAALRRSHAAAPVRSAGSVPAAPSPEVRETHQVRPAVSRVPTPHRRRRQLPRRALPAAGLVALVLVAAVLGWVSGRVEAPAAASVPPLPSAPDWPVLLTQLDAARESAFAAGDPAGLEQVWAPGSAGAVADRALLQGLAEQRRAVSGLRHTVRSVEVVEGPRAGAPGEGDPTATLTVVDVLAGHRVTDAAGAVVHEVPARAAATWSVELRLVPDGWRLASVTPV